MEKGKQTPAGRVFLRRKFWQRTYATANTTSRTSTQHSQVDLAVAPIFAAAVAAPVVYDDGSSQTTSVASPVMATANEPSQTSALQAALAAQTAYAETLVSVPADLSFPLPVYRPPARPRQIVVRRPHRGKKIAKGFGMLAMVAVLSGSAFTARNYYKFQNVFQGTTTVAALTTKEVKPDTLKGEGSGRVNIALLGVGGGKHDGADLTDTILIASIDPVNNTAALLSIPRDLWVKMPVNTFGQNQKINAAYSAGKYAFLGKTDSSNANKDALKAGFNSVDKVLQDTMGVRIDYHVLVDFQAFQQAVDTVGGVKLDVKEALVDPTMAWENDNKSTLVAAGPQQLDGRHALMYARSRETSSDFARSERQRQLMLALKDKVLSAGTLSNPAKIEGLISAFGDNVYSDLSGKAVSRLVSIGKNINNSAVTQLSLTSDTVHLVTTDRVGSYSVVRPTAGFNNYDDIQNYIRTGFRDGYLAKENADVQVLAATQLAADASAATLKTYGYHVFDQQVSPVLQASTADGRVGVRVADLSKGSAPYTLHYLQDRYGVTAQTALPDGITVPPTVKFVILVDK